MRNLGRWLAAAAFAALWVVASAPALGDDVVLVSAQQRIRIGALVLDPGSYLLRADSSMGTRNVLLVTSPDEKTFYGFVLANHESSEGLRTKEDRLLFDETDGRTLRTWVVAWRGVGYHFTAAPIPMAMASRTRLR